MVELRSFVIGGIIAISVIALVALAVGGSGDQPSGSAFVIPGTTFEVPPTRPPSTIGRSTPQTVSESPVATRPASGVTPQTTAAPGTATPRATGTTAASPTPSGPTPTPQPSPTPEPVNEAASYQAALAPLAADFRSLVSYLIDRATTPNTAEANWRQFTQQAASDLRAVDARLRALSPPACLASAQSNIASGANQADAAANAISAAAQNQDAGAASATRAQFSAALGTFNQGATAAQAGC